MHETGHSGPVHWYDPEGWDGEGGGSGVQDGEPMVEKKKLKDTLKYLLTKNSPGPDSFRARSTNLIPILCKLPNNRKENFSTHFLRPVFSSVQFSRSVVSISL